MLNSGRNGAANMERKKFGNNQEWKIARVLLSWASLIAQLVKNLPAMQEILVQFLGQEDPLEKG